MKNFKTILSIKTILFFTVITVLLSTRTPGFAQQIKLLVIIDDTEPLIVNYLTIADVNAENFLSNNILISGVLPDLIVPAVVEIRNKKHSSTLQKLLGDFGSRENYLRKMLMTGFTNQTDKIELSFININDSEKYISGKKPDYESLKKDNWHYIMHLKETAGFSTPKNNLGKLSVSSTFDIKVYDVIGKKRIFKQQFTSWHPETFELDSVLTDKTIFTSFYPLSQDAGKLIYSRLARKDVLHKMASTYGFETEFPPRSIVLQEYENSFSYELFMPDDWKNRKTRNPAFLYWSLPKKSGVSILTEIDLLIKPLGQNYLSISDYVGLRISEIQTQDITVRPLEKDLQILDLKEEWSSYMYHTKNGRFIYVYIMLHRIAENEYIVNHKIMVSAYTLSTWEKYKEKLIEQLIEQKEGIEAHINNSKLILK